MKNWKKNYVSPPGFEPGSQSNAAVHGESWWPDDKIQNGFWAGKCKENILYGCRSWWETARARLRENHFFGPRAQPEGSKISDLPESKTQGSFPGRIVKLENEGLFKLEKYGLFKVENEQCVKI